jgi:hypothetical protein
MEGEFPTSVPISYSFLANKRNLSFTDLVTIPEDDSWIYTNSNGTRKGSASVCCVFVMRMWKAGGIFGDLADSIQV